MNNKHLIFIFSVIVVLLLVFFIFKVNFPTSAFISLAGVETCEGTCTVCTNFPIQATCEIQDGCTWSISSCTGTPTACKDLSFENCSTHGCSWNESSSKCQGTPEPCPTYNSNQSLCNSGGCTWNSADCSGVCTVCTDFLNQETCEIQNGCSWDFGAVCGNDTKETGETCDGTDLDSKTCVTQGFDTGTLACQGDCSAFDTSSCTSYVCGNNTKEGTETCDGTDLDSQTCITKGYDSGTLTCESDCSAFITSSCMTDTVCGNNLKEGPEACDGTDLDSKTCVTQGYSSGSLFCFGDCLALDTSDCTELQELPEEVNCEDDCCGNLLCEENKNENFNTCRADCPNPATISFNFYLPEEGTRFARGETLIIKVEIIADSSNPSPSDVEWVKVTGFFGTEELYDDGLHNDDSEADSIYANSFFIDNSADATKHTLKVGAKVANTQQTAERYFIVDPILNIELSTDKETYKLGETIEIVGSVNRSSFPIEAPLILNIESEKIELFEWTGKSSEDGSYSLNFQTQFASSVGEWILTLETMDIYNNKGIVSKTINVTKSDSVSIATGAAVGVFNIPDTDFDNIFTKFLFNEILLKLLIIVIIVLIAFILSGIIIYFLRWKKQGFVPFQTLFEKIKNKLKSIKFFQNSKFFQNNKFFKK